MGALARDCALYVITHVFRIIYPKECGGEGWTEEASAAAEETNMLSARVGAIMLCNGTDVYAYASIKKVFMIFHNMRARAFNMRHQHSSPQHNISTLYKTNTFVYISRARCLLISIIVYVIFYGIALARSSAQVLCI